VLDNIEWAAAQKNADGSSKQVFASFWAGPYTTPSCQTTPSCAGWPAWANGAAAAASVLAAVLTEIYLCNVCSCHAILRRNGRGQACNRATAAAATAHARSRC
jgi:hypothetical protein